MRRLIASTAIGLALAAPALGCVAPVGPAPIEPSVTLVEVCTVTYLAKVRYTYTVHGSGYWWGHTASKNGLVEYLRDGSRLVFYAAGETWVYFAQDPDDDMVPGVEAPGGHLPAIWPINKECTA